MSQYRHPRTLQQAFGPYTADRIDGSDIPDHIGMVRTIGRLGDLCLAALVVVVVGAWALLG